MFLQTGGGGKGIRPSLQQQQQQAHHHQHSQQPQHHQQQQQQSATASTHQQQQQQQQHQSNHHQSHSHHSHHPGQHHQGPASQSSSTSLHLGHQPQQQHQHRQHAPPHPHLPYQQQYSAFTHTQIHIQGNNNAATAAALAQSAQMGGPTSGSAQASGNVACSTTVGSATPAIAVLGGIGPNGSAGGGSNGGGGGGGAHGVGNYGRNHGGGGAGGSGNMAHFGPNSALLQQPPPVAGSGFMTQPPPGHYLQQYHPHSQQSAVVLAAAAAAAAHFGNVTATNGGGGGNGSAGGSNSNGSAVNQNPGGGTGGVSIFATHPPPHSHPHRHPHPQTVAAFYGHTTSAPPPQTPGAHHMQHSHNQLRNVIAAHQRHQVSPPYMMPTIFTIPGGMPGHPQNGASPTVSQLMAPPTATPTHLPPPTYIPQPMTMIPTGMPPQPIMPPPSTLHTYAPPMPAINSLGGGSGLYTKEHAMKKRLHAIPIIDPNTNEIILGSDTQRATGSSTTSQEASDKKDNNQGQEGTSSSAELQSKMSTPAVGVAVAVTVSPSLLSETRETDKTITPTLSVEANLNAKTDQQMQTDAVTRSQTDDEDTASITTITGQDGIVELTNNNNNEPLSPHSADTLVDNMISNHGVNDKNADQPIYEPQEGATQPENIAIDEYSDEDGDISCYDIPFPTGVSVDLSINEELLDEDPTVDDAPTPAYDSAAQQTLVSTKPLDKVNIDEVVPFIPAVTPATTANEHDTFMPPSNMARASGSYKEPLLQIPKYAVKQDPRASKTVQKTVPLYGGNHLNYQNVKTQMQPQQQYQPYQQHFVYHHPQHQQQHTQPQQQPLHPVQYQLPHAQMQKMYHQSSTSSSASSLSGFNAPVPAVGKSGTPTSSSNSSTSGIAGVGGVGGNNKSKKNRKNSRNTKERDKKLKQQMERERTYSGVQSNETGSISIKNNTDSLSGSVNNKSSGQKSIANNPGRDENAAPERAATVMNAKPSTTTDLTNKNHPNVGICSNIKNGTNSSDTPVVVEDEKEQKEECKSSTADSPAKNNRHRKDSDKFTKTQRPKDSQGKVDIDKKKQQNQRGISPAPMSEDVKPCEDSAPIDEDTTSANRKCIRTQDIVERFLQPTPTPSNSQKSNGEDSQLQFLNSSSSACEEEEELLQQEMQARQASEVSTEGILFGDFGEDNDEPLQTEAQLEGATSIEPQQPDETIFRPPSSTSGSTKTPHATPLPTPQPTPKSTPASSPGKSRKSSIDSNASGRRGNRGREHYHQNQKGGAAKERERDKDRNQEKGKTKAKEAKSQQVELVGKPQTDDKIVALPQASGGPGHRYTLDLLKTLAKSKESLKPPMVMNCHKGDCISHLFVPRPHNAGNQQPFSTAPHQQQYQQMNFNESIEFVNKRRGGSSGGGGGVSGNMSKRQQSGSGSAGGGGGISSSVSLNAQAQRHMDYIRVHLSLKEEIKLSECVNAWQPEAIRSRTINVTAAGGSGAGLSSQNDDIDVVLKKVRGVLNKLTPDNFDVLLKTMTSIAMNTEEKMKQVMLLIFEKTVSEPNFAPTYAKFCKVLFQELKSENKSLFSTLLIKRIQQEFETNVNNADAKRIKLQPLVDKLSSCTDAKERVELQAELDDQEYQFRRRAWGTVRFIGEMYKLQSITSERVLSCIELLLEHGSEEKLEYMCKLLTTVGHQLEQTVADHANLHGRMDKIFKAIHQIVVRSQEASGGGGAVAKKSNKNAATPKISSRVRFMMQDVIDLRSRFWDQPNLLNRGAPSSSSQRGRHASTRQDDKSRQNSSSSTTPASSSSASTRPSGGGVAGGYAGVAASANPIVRRQPSDLREHSSSRSGSGSGSYFLKKKEQQQQQQQQQPQIEQPKLNIDVNKLPFSRDEEQTKLGNPSMYMWRTAAGKQSATACVTATQSDRNPWDILGNVSALNALHQQQQNNGRNNNAAATTAGATAGAGKNSPHQTENNNNRKKSTASESKLLEKELNEIDQHDDEVWYTMTSAECQKILNRLVEEFQDDQGHNNNACNDDTWKSSAMHIWRSLSTKQQISLLYNILLDYLHLAAVKSAQRNALATIFSYLLQNSDKLSINRKKFNIAYKRVGEEFADLLVDVPNGWIYVFEFLGPMIHENTLTFNDVWLTKWLDDCKFTERFLIAFITYFTREFGVKYIRELWSREHLERGQRFMKKETGSGKRWDNFIASNQFQYIYERNSKSKHQQKQLMKQLQQKHQPHRNTDEQLERIDYLIRTSSDCELAIDYVSTNVNLSEPFIRSLSTFLCCDLATVVVDSATINNNAQTDSCSTRSRSRINSDDGEEGEVFSSKSDHLSSATTTTPQLNPEAFRQCAVLLRFCIDANESFEMACLSGVIDTMHQRYEPTIAGELIRSTFSMLHESEVVSKETFNKWYRAYRCNELTMSAGPSHYDNDEDVRSYGAAGAAMRSQAEEFSAFMEEFLAN